MTEQDHLMQGPTGPSLAQETLDLMRLHGVPATGANYEVWLSYRLGRNAPLTLKEFRFQTRVWYLKNTPSV